MRHNEKGTCLLIDVSIIEDRIIFTFPVNGITDFPVNREMNGTEQLKVFYDFCKMKILWSSCW